MMGAIKRIIYGVHNYDWSEMTLSEQTEMVEAAQTELAQLQAIAAAARDARIALTFYREWMLTHGEGETRYPFGVDAERTLAAALEQETK